MDDNKFIAIMDKLSEVGERTARIETKQSAVENRLTSIEQDLSVHIKGTVVNTERLNIEISHREALADAHKNLKGRVEKLEIPVKAIAWIKSRILWISMVGGGIATILYLFKK